VAWQWPAGAAYHHRYLLQPCLDLVDAAAGGRSLRVIDIGCGGGYVAHALAQRAHTVTAVDADASALAVARTRYPAVEFRTLDLLADAGDGAAAYDLAVSLEVIEHLPRPRALFVHATRLLRPDGRLILSTPYHGYLKNLALSLTGGWDRHLDVATDGGHVKFFSRRSLLAMAAEHGFHAGRFVGVGRVPGLWRSMLVEFHRR